MFFVRTGVIQGVLAEHWVHLPSTVFASGTVLPLPPSLHLLSAFCQEEVLGLCVFMM